MCNRTTIETTCIDMFRGRMTHSMQQWVAENFLPKLLDYVEFPALHQTILGLRTSTIEREIKRFISSSSSINDLDYFGYTALAWASYQGCLPLIKTLIDHGADPNVESPQRISAVSASIASKAFECSLYLLEHGANPRTLAGDGRTALFLAVNFSRGQPLTLTLLDTLFHFGIDVNQATEAKETCLWGAVKTNNCDTLGWLLEHGADCRHSDNFELLSGVAWFGTLETVEVIRKARWSGIDIYATENGERKSPMEYLLHPERPKKASPQFVESFTQLLAEIEARKDDPTLEENKAEDKDEIFAGSIVLDGDTESEEESETFRDSVENLED